MKETDCSKCCVCAFKEDLCNGDFCEKYYREGNAEDFEKLLPHWIPCSERLPDELAEVNVTWVNTAPPVYYEFLKGKRFTGTAIYFNGEWYWYSSTCLDMLKEYGKSPADIMDGAIEVIAWMPLPEPYREEGDS